MAARTTRPEKSPDAVARQLAKVFEKDIPKTRYGPVGVISAYDMALMVREQCPGITFREAARAVGKAAPTLFG